MPDIYVRVSDAQVHRTSCHSDNTVNVDLDGNGVPVGVEVLNAIGLEVDGHPVNLPQATGEVGVESVAKSFASSIYGAYVWDSEWFGDRGKQIFRSHARAAIAALSKEAT